MYICLLWHPLQRCPSGVWNALTFETYGPRRRDTSLRGSRVTRTFELLGDTIGMDLEVEAQETAVGPFRADILCKNTAYDDWVLIEIQLEATDYRHLD